MKFLIRDDDINYFTRASNLETIYKDIWIKCPISFSIVPFQACSKSGAIPEKYWQGEQIFPIGENKELINFLTKKIREKKITISLHGWSHKDYPKGPEFVAGKNLEKKVQKGKEYLEKLFGIKITAFVPPHNALSQEGFEAIIKNNLNIIGIPNFRKFSRLKKTNYWLPFLKKIYYKIIYQSAYPYLMNFGDHREIGFYTLSPSANYKNLIKSLDFIYKKNGIFILATHHWEIKGNQTTREKFYSLWRYVQKFPKVEFISINDIFK